jgi:hypothetical protein
LLSPAELRDPILVLAMSQNTQGHLDFAVEVREIALEFDLSADQVCKATYHFVQQLS